MDNRSNQIADNQIQKIKNTARRLRQNSLQDKQSRPTFDLTLMRNSLIRAKGILDESEHRKVELESTLSKIPNAIKLLDMSSDIYKKAVDLIYAESIGKVSDTINSALAFIFWNHRITARLLMSDSRGKSLVIEIMNHSDSDPQWMNIKRSSGKGIKTVISFIVSVIYLENLGIDSIFIDEAYSYLSEEYVKRFFVFMQEYCKSKNFHVIMVSHDPRFSEYANKTYKIVNGQLVFEKGNQQ